MEAAHCEARPQTADFSAVGGRLERGRLRMSGSAVVRAFGLAGVQDHSLINPGESERSRP